MCIFLVGNIFACRFFQGRAAGKGGLHQGKPGGWGEEHLVPGLYIRPLSGLYSLDLRAELPRQGKLKGEGEFQGDESYNFFYFAKKKSQLYKR
jgi:hypothetical protein